jgi:LacI family transcriptional regulator
MAVTLKDIAKVAGVSYATVSRALSNHPDVNDETRDKIKKIAKEMKYTPDPSARGLKGKNTNTIALVVPDISNPFFSELTLGVESYANENGYSVFLCNTNWDYNREKTYIDILIAKRVDGIIISPVLENALHHTKLRIPLVYITEGPKYDDIYYVGIDNKMGAILGVEYLIKLGHKDIVYVGGAEKTSANRERFEGFKETMEKYGLKVNANHHTSNSFSRESGYKVAMEILIKDKIPTAVFAVNDIVALGVIQAIEEFGLNVPSDISVIGFDDISFSSMHRIKLTTISQPKLEIGKMSTEILIDLLNNKDVAEKNKILKPNLVIRNTCSAVK